MKRRAPAEGDVVEIPLGEGRRAYGRLLSETLVEYYDQDFGDGELADIDMVVQLPVGFRIFTMSSKGRWATVGQVPLSDQEREQIVRFFKQDPITDELSIYWTDRSGGVHEVPATREECEQLERAAVWSAEHVEDRLRDRFAGRPNIWTESLRVK